MLKKSFILNLFLSNLSLFAMECCLKDQKYLEQNVLKKNFKESSQSLLENLPIELIVIVSEQLIIESISLTEAIKNYKNLNHVLLASPRKIELLKLNKFTKKEIKLFSKLLDINPIFVANMLKVELSEKFKNKVRKLTFEKYLLKYNYNVENLNKWWNVNISSKKMREDDSIRLINKNPIIGILALRNSCLEPYDKYAYEEQIFKTQASNGNKEAVKLILAICTNPNIIEIGDIAIMRAIEGRHHDVVQILLNLGVSPNYRPKTLSFAVGLIEAINKRDNKMVALLLRAGAKVEIINGYGVSPLMEAARENQKELVQLFLNFRPNIDLQEKYGYTALMFAVRRANSDIVKLLLDAKANPNLKSQYSYTALLLAVQKGNEDIVKQLLEAGANPSIEDKDHNTALSESKKLGSTTIYNLLMAHEAQKFALKKTR